MYAICAVIFELSSQEQSLSYLTNLLVACEREELMISQPIDLVSRLPIPS
jgi:hypothetical protein